MCEDSGQDRPYSFLLMTELSGPERSFLCSLSSLAETWLSISVSTQQNMPAQPLPSLPDRIHSVVTQVSPGPWPYIMQSIRGQGAVPGRAAVGVETWGGRGRVQGMSLLLLGSQVLPRKPVFSLHHVRVASESNPCAQLRRGTDKKTATPGSDKWTYKQHLSHCREKSPNPTCNQGRVHRGWGPEVEP